MLGTISKPNNQSTLVVGHLSTLRLETRIHEGMYTYIYAIGAGMHVQDGCAKVIFIMCILL